LPSSGKHFWYRRRFCIKRHASVGIDFLWVSFRYINDDRFDQRVVTEYTVQSLTQRSFAEIILSLLFVGFRCTAVIVTFVEIIAVAEFLLTICTRKVFRIILLLLLLSKIMKMDQSH